MGPYTRMMEQWGELTNETKKDCCTRKCCGNCFRMRSNDCLRVTAILTFAGVLLIIIVNVVLLVSSTIILVIIGLMILAGAIIIIIIMLFYLCIPICIQYVYSCCYVTLVAVSWIPALLGKVLFLLCESCKFCELKNIK